MLFLSFSSKDNRNVWHKNSDFPCLSTFQQQTMTLLPLLTKTAHWMWSNNLKESQAVRVLIIVERPLALYAQKKPAPIRQVYTVCQCMKEERTGPVFCINNGHAPLLLDQCAFSTQWTGLRGSSNGWDGQMRCWQRRKWAITQEMRSSYCRLQTCQSCSVDVFWVRFW